MSTINVGDYIRLGRYSGESILWRCVDMDEHGPLMLSDKILCLKAFDSPGTHYYADGSMQNDADGVRRKKGSNNWVSSNIRSWLNSSAEAGKVSWLNQCPPSEDKFKIGTAAYATEAGFLSAVNFTAEEKMSIKPVTLLTRLNELDRDKVDTDIESQENPDQKNRAKRDLPKLGEFIKDYDPALKASSQDFVFLLDDQQLLTVWNNLGHYYLAYPTDFTVNMKLSKSKYAFMPSPNRDWLYWLRTPVFSKLGGSNVLVVFTSDMQELAKGRDKSAVGTFPANKIDMGIRPAFYLNLEADFQKVTEQDDKPVFGSRAKPDESAVINDQSVIANKETVKETREQPAQQPGKEEEKTGWLTYLLGAWVIAGLAALAGMLLFEGEYFYLFGIAGAVFVLLNKGPKLLMIIAYAVVFALLSLMLPIFFG